MGVTPGKTQPGTTLSIPDSVSRGSPPQQPIQLPPPSPTAARSRPAASRSSAPVHQPRQQKRAPPSPGTPAPPAPLPPDAPWPPSPAATAPGTRRHTPPPRILDAGPHPHARDRRLAQRLRDRVQRFIAHARKRGQQHHPRRHLAHHARQPVRTHRPVRCHQPARRTVPAPQHHVPGLAQPRGHRRPRRPRPAAHHQLRPPAPPPPPARRPSAASAAPPSPAQSATPAYRLHDPGTGDRGPGTGDRSPAIFLLPSSVFHQATAVICPSTTVTVRPSPVANEPDQPADWRR